MGLSKRLRTLLGSGAQSAAPQPAATSTPGHDVLVRSMNSVAREVARLRGLVYVQTDMLTESLHRAGWHSDEEVSQRRSLQRALRTVEESEDIIVGPWTGEVGFELLYWIPFLGWLAEQGMSTRRITVVSRGGAAAWYRHLTPRYVDLLDFMSVDEFRERTAGPKKQVDASRGLDREILDRVRGQLGLEKAGVVHPAALFQLLSSLWRQRGGVELIESFASYRRLSLPEAAAPSAAPALPAPYVACKFYFSKAFPDTSANRTFVADIVRTISRDIPVVLLSTAVKLDEHADFQTDGGSGVYVQETHTEPQRNLDVQTRLIAGARGFVGTYGGFSYLAPFYGVRAVSFFSRRAGFENHHLQLADRVFDALLPGGFVALDRRACELVEPAIARWTKTSHETFSA